MTLIDKEHIEAINRASPHIFVKCPGSIVCAKCKAEYDLRLPKKIWETLALTWGFAYEHADCEEENDDNQL